MNVLIEDLAHPAATLMQATLNMLPTELRVRVAEACEAGGKLELRMREGTPSVVALWLIGSDEAALQLLKYDTPPSPQT